MFKLNRPRWRISENETTPEAVFWNRRRVLAAGGGAAAAAGLIGAGLWPREPMPEISSAAEAAVPDQPFTPKPPLNPAYADAGRPVTSEEANSTYNNFYEFGSHKKIYLAAQELRTEGWRVRVEGLVEKEFEIDIDELIAQMPVEERIYRHRCVEAWSMVAPWIGFELAALVKKAAPLSNARFVEFKTFLDPEIARGQRQHWYPWAYTEGLTMAEAINPLTFMVVGAYGKVLPKQFGAPVRLHTPWKYGFKAIKSIDRIIFTDKQPLGFWEELQDAEYGFWANVNPEVSHPRWSQATERVLGTDERIPTQLFNGYGPEVAEIYAGMQEQLGDRLWR
ncbi:MAG: protein-methionine-sulfoxide reductase catalytic subunit MsrP [Pseudomonadota bacterium]